MKLSILIPVYNEIHTLPKLIERVLLLNIDKELILVDDYSIDGSREILKKNYSGKYNIKIIFHPANMGKGAAIKSALRHASGDFAIIQDADLEYNPEDFVLLLAAVEKKHVDVVYGSRFMKSWRVTSFPHFLVNKVLTVITNILYGGNITDMETCYKMIRTDVFKKLDIQSSRFDIEAEITAKLLKKGYEILEVPVSYKGRSYHEGKKITWKDGIATLWSLLKHKFIR